MFPVESIASTVVVLGASLIAGFTDVTRFKVYNVLTFPLAIASVAFHGWNDGLAGVCDAVLAIVAGLAVLMLPYAGGAIGAGDVKFFAAVLGWLGITQLLPVLLTASLAAGIYSSCVIARRHGLKSLWLNLKSSLLLLFSMGFAGRGEFTSMSVQEVRATMPDYRQRLVPFSAMIGLGVLFCVVRQSIAAW